MSLYKYLKDEDYFFIVYNASGEVVLNHYRIMVLPTWEHMTV